MSRPLRIQFDGAVYHVTSRGNDRQAIFRDDTDRQQFIDVLTEAVGRFGLSLHAFCLMPNHYHLLLTTPRGNLTRAMGWVQTAYTTRFNRRHRRSGHVVQGRYKAHLVEADAYARTLVRYIHLNPVRPRDHRRPVPLERRAELGGYRWSSHRAYAGLDPAPAWLCLEWLSYWGKTRPAARRAYAKDIDAAFGAALSRPWDELRGSLVLGGEALWEKAKAILGGGTSREELAWSERAGRERWQEVIGELAAAQEDRRLSLWVRVRLGGERMSDLAREEGYADGSGVLRVVQRLEQRAREDKGLARRLADLRRQAEMLSARR